MSNELSTNLDVVHLFNTGQGARYNMMISQGLYKHPMVTPYFSSDFVSHDKVIRCSDADIESRLKTCDFIFVPNIEHFNTDYYVFLDQEKLWHKVIYYDLKDYHKIDEKVASKCLVYIKRSFPIGYNRKPRRRFPNNVLPMDYCALDEYFLPDTPTRDINLTYLFDESKSIGSRRYRVLCELKRVENKFANSRIGAPTTSGRSGRRSIIESRKDSPWENYLQLLRRSKVVMTAYPANWDGDSRTWEAFSSGGLVIMDKTFIPHPYPYIDKVHTICYDARKEKSIRQTIGNIKELLIDDSLRTEIAEAGYNHTRKYHSSEARVEMALKFALSLSL